MKTMTDKEMYERAWCYTLTLEREVERFAAINKINESDDMVREQLAKYREQLEELNDLILEEEKG